MIALLKNKWFKFAIAAAFYLLWVIWVQNFWLLPGLGIIYDIYISGKVHWAFWKKKGVKKQTKLVEWIDAIIFAVVAATFIRMFFLEAYTIPTSSMEKSLLVGDYLFVSKVAYGPKIPNTPLSFPFVHHTMPLSTETKSYLEWIKWPYRRIAGFGKIKNNDVVVFNYPDGDTLSTRFQSNISYYSLVRQYGRDYVWNNPREFGDIISRPVDKRENFIKRCVAIPGDSLKIVNGQVFVNGKAQTPFTGIQFNYVIKTDGSSINPKIFEKLRISQEDLANSRGMGIPGLYVLPLTEVKAKEIAGLANVVSIEKNITPDSIPSANLFPYSADYPWNIDNFGTIWIPAKGTTVELNLQNLPLYQRIIDVYEENDLQVKGNKIYINGKPANSYTFKMDYYWLMGDNRHNSADSRYWGFVPEDHVVGKAVFTWLSLDKDYGLFSGKIRWDRLFSVIR
jgi:signal peptidase I